ncbi:hypothetical protein HL667_24670 [Bradyrhizobium sp. 83012]|jgi:hypothetical protein|uniref:Uncharacterized protein n=1 Tax=Bradyrhizobium aeschynomenes TaxID=2734909 RepID=A0ABX2CJ54_9BRAD|nr:hypothetical protein [Bradyrhizobium aeschynomenes]NPU11130.1 hypothetical protein [Bradyrhizobium aeschynomenes]NPU68219.1 hypothetical protein [Bradyrhizobium aeschynomenes]NPV21791.1 hypothetical protein [Bradyrhizobium aeschynomenes]
MRRAVLTTVLMGMTATAAWADDLFWVVGNRATNRCEIVTSNPVIIGDIWFASGPFKSKDDAKLARSTINACPNKDMTQED